MTGHGVPPVTVGMRKRHARLAQTAEAELVREAIGAAQGSARPRRPRAFGGACSGASRQKGEYCAKSLEILARPEGFEPPTLGFEDRYSIQLSYGRVAGVVSRAARPSKTRAGSSTDMFALAAKGA